MASISKEPNGRRMLQFKGPDGKRKSVRLGKVDKTIADEAKTRVEELLTAIEFGRLPGPVTLRWVDSLSPAIYNKLAKSGVLSGRKAATLDELLSRFMEGKVVKASTEANIENCLWCLRKHFTKSRLIRDISPGDAKAFKAWMLKEGRRKKGPLSPSTVSRRIARSHEIFEFAVDERWLESNPFEGLVERNETNKKRMFRVDVELFNSVLEQVPDQEFRTILALCRYGGLRCPSEILSLRWGQVNWGQSTLAIESSKQEHQEDGGVRIMPLFPEMQEAIDALWAEAKEKADLMFPKHQCTGANLRNRLQTACRAAGVVMWPRPFQNMRSTRETEIAEQFPAHVATAWLGNSPEVARQHYFQVFKDHHQRALGLRTNMQHPSNEGGQVLQNRMHGKTVR